MNAEESHTAAAHLTTATTIITVLACKYDNQVHRQWPAHLSQQKGSLLVLDGRFEEQINHPLLGTIQAGTRSTEYYWTDRWYSVFRFAEPTGQLRNYYCNVNMPARLADSVLSFVDLDVDVLVHPDFSYQLLDEDEFKVNTLRFGYPPEVCRQAALALDELRLLIDRRAFPFDR